MHWIFTSMLEGSIFLIIKGHFGNTSALSVVSWWWRLSHLLWYSRLTWFWCSVFVSLKSIFLMFKGIFLFFSYRLIKLAIFSLKSVDSLQFLRWLGDSSKMINEFAFTVEKSWALQTHIRLTLLTVFKILWLLFASFALLFMPIVFSIAFLPWFLSCGTWTQRYFEFIELSVAVYEVVWGKALFTGQLKAAWIAKKGRSMMTIGAGVLVLFRTKGSAVGGRLWVDRLIMVGCSLKTIHV